MAFERVVRMGSGLWWGWCGRGGGGLYQTAVE